MRYPGATWRGPVPNTGGPMGPVRLGVVHIMEGTLAGTDSWFHDPASQVSAHFGVGKDGTGYQWVDTDAVAWAEMDYNGEAISIEHEGNSGDALTQAQIGFDIGLFRWLNATKGLPYTRQAWVGHGELGVAGGNHPDCPGAPILSQLPWILAAAADINPQPQPEEFNVELYATNSAGTGFVIAADLSHKQGMPDPGDAARLLATGVYKPVQLTDQLINAIPG